MLAFNWPLYTAGGAACAAALAVAAWPSDLPTALRAAAWVGASTSAYLLVAAVAVSWWVYDRSGLYDWTWILGSLPRAPARWAACHAGFDEASADLTRLLGRPPVAVLDLWASLPRRTGSLRRARTRSTTPPGTVPAQLGRLPVPDRSLDAAFLVFAAHEIRRRGDRERLFAELARVVASNGSLVLVEHARDLPAVLAFGPGAWHFLPRREWLALAARAGFSLDTELRKTPFVRGYVLCRR